MREGLDDLREYAAAGLVMPVSSLSSLPQPLHPRERGEVRIVHDALLASGNAAERRYGALFVVSYRLEPDGASHRLEVVYGDHRVVPDDGPVVSIRSRSYETTTPDGAPLPELTRCFIVDRPPFMAELVPGIWYEVGCVRTGAARSPALLLFEERLREPSLVYARLLASRAIVALAENER